MRWDVFWDDCRRGFRMICLWGWDDFGTISGWSLAKIANNRADSRGPVSYYSYDSEALMIPKQKTRFRCDKLWFRGNTWANYIICWWFDNVMKWFADERGMMLGWRCACWHHLHLHKYCRARLLIAWNLRFLIRRDVEPMRKNIPAKSYVKPVWNRVL